MKNRAHSFNNWLLVTLSLGVLLYFIYAPGLHGPFLLDDLQTLELAKLTKFSFYELLSVSLQNDTGPIGRPMSVASFAINHYFFGFSAYHYKLMNYIIHIICAFTLGFFVFLLCRLIPKVRPHAKMIAFLCAFIWALHPLQVSTVLYIVQRMSQLSALFTLLALNFYLVARTLLLTKPSYALIYIAVSVGLFFPLAILSKENALLFPLYLLAIEVFILKFRCAKASSIVKLKSLIYGLCAIFFISAIGYLFIQYDFIVQVYHEKNLTLVQRLFTEIKVLIFYLYLIAIPRVSNMSLWHDDFEIAFIQDPFTWLSIVLFTSLIALIYYFRKKHPIISFGLSWFLISHLLECSVLPLELVFEHRNYLASIGIFIIPAYYFVTICPKLPLAKRLFCYAVLGMVLLLMGFLTFLRIQSWQSSNDLMLTAQIYQPRSPRVLIESANWYAENKGYDTALAQLDKAFSLQPNNTGILLHKMLLLCLTKQTIPSELYHDIKKSIEKQAITPYILISLNALVTNTMHQHCNNIDNKKMIEILDAAMQNKYLNHRKKYHAVLYHLQAGLYLFNNQSDVAQQLLLKSFNIYPKRVDPLFELAYFQIRNGDLIQAMKTIALIEEKSQFPYSNQEKINHLKQALRMESSHDTRN